MMGDDGDEEQQHQLQAAKAQNEVDNNAETGIEMANDVGKALVGAAFQAQKHPLFAVHSQEVRQGNRDSSQPDEQASLREKIHRLSPKKALPPISRRVAKESAGNSCKQRRTAERDSTPLHNVAVVAATTHTKSATDDSETDESSHRSTVVPPKSCKDKASMCLLDTAQDEHPPAPIDLDSPQQQQQLTRRRRRSLRDKIAQMMVMSQKNPQRSIDLLHACKSDEPATSEGQHRKRPRICAGVTEEEALTRTLPDILSKGLRVLVVGINPGVWSSAKGRHYAGPGNHFWPCLNASGILPPGVVLTCDDDMHCVNFGIGFVNMVTRTTRGMADLSRHEIENGCAHIERIAATYKPSIVCFNGKGIYQIFSRKSRSSYGVQATKVAGCKVFVMPSTSPRGATFPRWTDKLPFFKQLAALLSVVGKVEGEISPRKPSQLDKTAIEP